MIGRQLISFAFVGFLLNSALYGAYILLTHTMLGSLAAMTVTYCSGVIMSFVLNRRFTFVFNGDGNSAFVRFLGAYLLGYLANFGGLWLLAHRCGIPHELVQLGMVFGVAALLFLLQKYWVFAARSSCDSPPLASSGP
jgi:putative flippase GtrA